MMLIQVGDKVEIATECGKGKSVEGYITNIRIHTNKQQCVHTKEYDTSLNYKGVIDYQTRGGKLHSAGLNQLRKVNK